MENKLHLEIFSYYHFHKSLIYFDDAEKMPKPKMLISTAWNDVKKTIIQKVKILNQNFK
jgi:hypothetical protein